jgi:hypothetical protein
MSEAPHCPQKRVPGSFSAEQLGQARVRGSPQLPQNLLSGGLA